MVDLRINNAEISVQDGTTVLDAALSAGFQIPALCDDPSVAKYGSCGVCVVENRASGRLIRACSTIVTNGMDIFTDNKRAQFARKGALDLLLSDHSGDCRPPCSRACPAETDCQGYVNLAATGAYKEALELVREKIPFPASIGRVCPRPCEDACRRALVEQPISIAKIKQFLGDFALGGALSEKEQNIAETGKKVAIIGGGPGGLSAAYFLRLAGHAPVVFDANPQAGGMLRYGIPEYRLPKHILSKEIEILDKMGVTIRTNVKIGRDETFDDIRRRFDAVIIAIGAQKSASARCKGDETAVGGIEFLRAAHDGVLNVSGKTVAVIGGGNTAMDVCRTAVRFGAAAVYDVYRRTRDEMPADKAEIAEAEEEGVIFKELLAPVEMGENTLKLQIMRLGEPDERGRRTPVPVEGKTFTLTADVVVAAIGQQTDAAGFEPIELTKNGNIRADESTFATNVDGVFAIGDAVNKGADIAIAAIGGGKRAAESVNKYLNGESPYAKKAFLVEKKPTAADFADEPRIGRVCAENRAPDERKNDFDEICGGFTPEQTAAEAARCLKCGCHAYNDCKLLKFANDYNADSNRFAGEKSRADVVDIHKNLERNAEKCILCGLCVRVCKEATDAGALGFVGRGFNVVVDCADNARKGDAPEDCDACGKCLALCPTGALREKI